MEQNRNSSTVGQCTPKAPGEKLREILGKRNVAVRRRGAVKPRAEWLPLAGDCVLRSGCCTDPAFRKPIRDEGLQSLHPAVSFEAQQTGGKCVGLDRRPRTFADELSLSEPMPREPYKIEGTLQAVCQTRRPWGTAVSKNPCDAACAFRRKAQAVLPFHTAFLLAVMQAGWVSLAFQR